MYDEDLNTSRPGTEEDILLKVKRYRDPKGRPTCGIDFPRGRVCQFLMFTTFGTKPMCCNALPYRLYDTVGDGTGYIKPHPTKCLIWQQEDISTDEKESGDGNT